MRAAAALPATPLATAATPSVRRTRWDALTIVLACVILQYVWRIQEVLPALALIQFTSLISGLAILLFLVDRKRLHRLSLLRHPIFRAVLVIFVLSVLSVPMSVHARVSYDFVTGNFVKTVLLVGIMVASLRDRADIDRMLRIWVLGSVVYVALSMVMAVPGSGRLGGGGGNFDPNDLGLFTVCTLPLCAYLVRRGGRRTDALLGLITAILLVMAVVKTGSRGGFLALLCTIAYGVVAVNAVPAGKRIIVTIVAGAALLIVAGESYWSRMSTILEPDRDYNWAGQAESGRIEIWKRGIQYMLKRPVLGVGANAFSIAEGTMAEQAAARRAMGMGFKWSAAHNSYIEIGAELGVLGLAAFLFMMVAAFREARRIGRSAFARADRLLGHALAALILGFGIGGAFVSQAYATFLYFALGILIALSKILAQSGDHPVAAVSPSIAVAASPIRTGRRQAPLRRGGLR